LASGKVTGWALGIVARSRYAVNVGTFGIFRSDRKTQDLFGTSMVEGWVFLLKVLPETASLSQSRFEK